MRHGRLAGYDGIGVHGELGEGDEVRHHISSVIREVDGLGSRFLNRNEEVSTG